MTDAAELLIRNVELQGQAKLDIHVRAGRIVEIGRNLARATAELDGNGGALLPGLIDHHIHLLACAAESNSVRVDPSTTPNATAFSSALRRAAASGPGWVRATGYHDSVAGPLTRECLDQIVPAKPVRIQQRTGSLWTLNSAALDQVLNHETAPPCVERDAEGRPTGRIWRGDAWLRSRLPSDPVNLAGIGAMLASWGVTGVTDASASTGQKEAELLAEAVRSGALPQQLTLMTADFLDTPADHVFAVGPVKILLDEHDPPDFMDMTRRITQARRWRRTVAVHCTTAVELALTLAVFEEAGSVDGDRIEHGSVIPASSIDVIARLGLTVVTQPAFIFERGDRYLMDVDSDDHDSLYRCGSLLNAKVKVASSSDAPYTKSSPWQTISTAVSRCTRSANVLGISERVTPETALSLFLGATNDPGGPSRLVCVGALANLCLLKYPLARSLTELSANPVAATLVNGRIAFRSQ